MKPDMEQPVSRRKAFVVIAAALAGSAATLATSAEAKPNWGRPYGWSRGRKRGWAKRGGPKWRW
jgi:Spy/CpxP family protein refolding chaperone